MLLAAGVAAYAAGFAALSALRHDAFVTGHVTFVAARVPGPRTATRCG